MPWQREDVILLFDIVTSCPLKYFSNWLGWMIGIRVEVYHTSLSVAEQHAMHAAHLSNMFIGRLAAQKTTRGAGLLEAKVAYCL